MNNRGRIFWGRLRETIYFIEGGLLVFMLLSMIILAVVQIVMRNMLGTGLVWSDAVVRILVLWVAFFGAMIGSRKGEHINIELLSHYFPAYFYIPIQRVVSLISGIMSLGAAWICMQFVLVEYEEQTIAFAEIPAWICELILPVGFLVIALRFVINALVPPSESAPVVEESLPVKGAGL